MAVVKVWGRGQLTIPASLRKELRLDEETTLSVVKAGEALVLTPKKLIGDAVAKKAARELKKTGLTLDDLLRDLEKQRRRYNRERYGG
ncbi:MAG: AbrB/MazE/SpoVT family DNA-binding domain-containing protein [Nitrospirae bacterium]|nr:AbrB/MazE/SpoVT family DNA-binding domain-containing protein [Nitrospirota bacterium]